MHFEGITGEIKKASNVVNKRTDKDTLEEQAVDFFKGVAGAMSNVKEDMVNHPPHYEGKTSLECIEVAELVLGYEGLFYFCIGNAFTYLWRYKHKNGQEDIDKAGWYVNKAYSIMQAYDAFYLEDKYIPINNLYCRIRDCEKAAEVMPKPKDPEEPEEERHIDFDTLRRVMSEDRFINGL